MTIDIPWQVERAGPMARTIYTGIIERDGPQAEKFATMLALQSPPAIRGTNDQFLRGKKNGEQFNLDDRLERGTFEMYRRQAQAAGVSIEGKYYYSDAADYPGDPRAWHGSKEDLSAYIRSRGWKCDALGIKGQEVEVQDTPYCVSDEIVDEAVEKIREEHPEAGATPRELADLKEHLRQKMSGAMYGKK